MTARHEMRCTAIVRVTLEIPLTQPWDPKTPIGDVHRQAAREASARAAQLAPQYLMVGDPVVEIITTTRHGAG